MLAYSSYITGSGLDDLVYVQPLNSSSALSGNAIAVAPTGSEQARPDVAYNPEANEYLLTWQDGRSGNLDIYAQLLQASGALTGTELGIETGSNDQNIPQAAYISNGGSGQYLVSWRHHVSTDTFKPRAKLLDSTGNTQVAPFNIVGNIYDYRAYFDITANGSNKYLAVWDVDNGGEANIKARLVNPNGTKESVKTIANPDTEQRLPVAAYNSADNQYLLAWEDHRSGYPAIYGQRLDSNAAKLGSNVPLSRLTVTRNNPAVTANPTSLTDNTYLAMWEENSDIYGQWLNATGQGIGLELAVGTTAGDEDDPAVAYNEATNQALIVWHSDHGSQGDDIYGQRVYTNGLVGDVITVTAATADQHSPRLTANPQNGEWLATWLDKRDGGYWRIYARRVYSDSGLGPEFEVTDDAEEVDVIYNPDLDEFLVVWVSYPNNSSYVYVQRVSSSGSLIGPAQAIGANNRDVFDISVSYGDGQYLLVWSDGFSSNDNTILAQRMLSTGTLTGGIISVYDNNHYKSQSTVIYDTGLEQYLIVWSGWDAQRILQGRRLDRNGTSVAPMETLVDIWWSIEAHQSQLAYHSGLKQSLLVWRKPDTDILAQPYAVPRANFGTDPASGNAPLAVTFINTSTNATNFTWDFGNGITQTISHSSFITQPSSFAYTYTQPGVYTVTLTAALGQESHTQTQPVTVYDAGLPYADFSAAPFLGPLPLAVTFSNTSLNATEYQWDFGNGVTSTLQHPVYTYTQAGVYTVSLTAINGSNTDTKTRAAYITAYHPPILNFNAAPLTGIIPLTVTFTNTSLNATEYQWDFGDGNSSFITHPSSFTTTHGYTTPGVYTVTLHGGNGYITNTLTQTHLITTYASAVADFSAFPLSGTALQIIQFLDNSSYAKTYLWHFGDGLTSTLPSPTHTYQSAGIYTVSLTASNPVSSDTLTRTAYININELKLESGVVQAGSGYVTVPLTHTYDNMVVVATVNYSNNTIPVVTRVRNAQDSSFELKLQNPDNLASPITETVHYLVMEEGAYTLPDGRAIAGRVISSTTTDAKNSWTGQPVSYLQSYTNPVVLGQVMSANDANWSVFWSRNDSGKGAPPNSSSLRVGKHVGSDTNTARSDELLGVIVIEQGSGAFAGTAYQAAPGSDSVQGIGNQL